MTASSASRRRRCSIALGALFLCGATPRTDAASPSTQVLAATPRSVARVTGRLLRPDGRPLANARVALVSDASLASLDRLPAFGADDRRLVPAPQSVTATSDADGRFALDGLDPLHRFQLVTEVEDGGTDVRVLPFTLQPDRTSDLGDVVMPSAVPFEGRLVDARARGVAGCDVALVDVSAVDAGLGPGDFGRDCGLLFRDGDGASVVWTAPTWLQRQDREHTFLPRAATTYRTVTDSEGRFRVHGDPSAPLCLTVRIPGVDAVLTHELPATATREIGQLLVPETRELELLVVDSRDAPVADADLRLGFADVSLPADTSKVHGEAQSSGPLVLGAPQKTNSDGRARLRVLASRAAVVCVRPPGGGSWIPHEWTPHGDELVTVRIPPLHSVRVRVSEAQSRPISASARVHVLARASLPSAHADELGLLPLLVPTSLGSPVEVDGTRELRFDGLCAGSYDVCASSYDGSTLCVPLLLGTDDARRELEASLQLQAARPLRVRVTTDATAAQHALAGALVSWRADGAGSGTFEWGRALTDESGEVVIADRGTGRLLVVVQHPTHAWTEVTRNALDAASIAIHLARGGELHGCIGGAEERSKQRLVAEVVPRFGSADAIVGNTQRLPVDEEHCFRALHLPAGEYDVRVYASDAEYGATTGFAGTIATCRATVQNGSVTRVSLALALGARIEGHEGARVRGLVRRNGEPWGGAVVRLSRTWPSTAGVIERLRASDAGEYATALVPRGTYTVDVELERRHGEFDTIATRDIEIRAGDATTVDFDVVLNGPLTGRVVPATDGAPLQGAWVVARSEDGLRFRVDCDDNGAFSFRELPAGDYQLTADALECIPSLADARVPDRGELPVVRIELRPGPRVRGRVTLAGATNRSALHVRFELVAQDPSARSGPVERTLAVDAGTGEFRTRSLPPGRYRVFLLPGDATKSADRVDRLSSLVVSIPTAGLEDLALDFQLSDDER